MTHLRDGSLGPCLITSNPAATTSITQQESGIERTVPHAWSSSPRCHTATCKGVERGDFREDLFCRLQVFDIRLAPLRERKSDIVLLSDAFLQEIAKSFGRSPAGLTRDAREALLQHDWPGNVRELRNALERAAILCDGGLIDTEHLSLYSPRRPVEPATTDLNTVERQTIETVMRECRGNKSKAAKRLGLSRTQLYGRLRKYDLNQPSA